MTPNHELVIVKVGLCECHAVMATDVHHRDFPEVHAEGADALAAGSQLVNHLTRALDNIGSGYRREAIERAIEDVKEYLQHEQVEVAQHA